MLIHVPLTHIDDNPFQRRQDYGDVQALAADIQQRGLLQVPRGRLLFDGWPQTSMQTTRVLEANGPGWPSGAAFRVQLAFGHRRLRAFRHLAEAKGGQWTAMPVYVEALDDDAMLDAVWSENQHRSDINPIEQAELLAEKLDRIRAAGGSQTTLATQWGLDRSTIANKLRLLDLPDEAQAAVRERRLSERQAIALLPVVEMAGKLNGQAISWSTAAKPDLYGPPIAPGAFLRHALAADVPSDAIREYGQRVLKHTGVPLPDEIASLDTSTIGPAVDEETPIVQPLCAGCLHRYNQHCLNRPCRDAKWKLLQKQLPTMAATHTGLPWSNLPEAEIFPTSRDELHALRQQYAAGNRDGMVITWRQQGHYDNWFSGPAGWRDPAAIATDWRKGLILGRVIKTPIASPPRAAWNQTRAEIDFRAKARAVEAVRDALLPLAQQPAALRVLGYFLLERSGTSMPEDNGEVVGLLTNFCLRYIYGAKRSEWRKVLEAAGLDGSVVEPRDESERLRGDAVAALADWYNHRDRGADNGAYIRAAAEVRRVAAAYHAAGVTADSEDRPDDLRELAQWLAVALADVEALEAPPAPQEPTQ